MVKRLFNKKSKSFILKQNNKLTSTTTCKHSTFYLSPLVANFIIMTILRIDRKTARELTVSAASNYIEMLNLFQKNRGWAKWPDNIIKIRKNLKADNYHALYDDERTIGIALIMSLMGVETFKVWNTELNSLSPSEQLAVIDEAMREVDEFDFKGFFPPESDEELEAAKTEFEQVSEEDKKEYVRRGQLFYGYMFAYFHNALSVMVFGEKLTSLVARAKTGDQDAFCKAVQIDRGLLIHHPYFSETKASAQNAGDEQFLADIAYRESNPTLRSKIRFPALYAVFSLLDSLSWLDDFKHSEILEICDAVNMDRNANHISDVSYVSKRLKEYRRFQQTGGLSMH